jgi:DNA-binding NtrC family response regulator
MIHILVIDDEENVLKQIVNFLKNSHPPQGETFEVEGKKDHQEALKLLEKFDPNERYYHIIITDMRMGVEENEGIAILEELTKKSPITIVLTAYASIPNCVAAMKAGAWDYLEKTPENGSDPYENLLKSIKAAYNERLKNPYRDRVHPDAKWVQEHMDELMQNYRGKVVAVLDRTVVDSDSDYKALTERLAKKFQTAKPMMVSIPDTSMEIIE